MRVCVLTTSYPRDDADMAGAFVRDAVEHLRGEGVEVVVVSPANFRHYGIAYGAGIMGNLRRSPWKVAALPLFLWSFARAARAAARNADLVHAHWLPSGLVAIATGRPFVVQLWGSDVELARRSRRAARAVLRRAELVVCASAALAESARSLGARDVRRIPAGVELPDAVLPPEEPPHILYVGRLSEEKGVLELVDATRGLPLVVVGDGPLRDSVPDAVGVVAPADVGRYYERAAVVVCPSRREGFGMACAEGMAHGRPVVASAVGGMLDLIEDGVTGIQVPPGDPDRLRAALISLLDDRALRERLGAAARERVSSMLSWSSSVEAMVDAYATAVARAEGRRSRVA